MRCFSCGSPLAGSNLHWFSLNVSFTSFTCILSQSRMWSQKYCLPLPIILISQLPPIRMHVSRRNVPNYLRYIKMYAGIKVQIKNYVVLICTVEEGGEEPPGFALRARARHSWESGRSPVKARFNIALISFLHNYLVTWLTSVFCTSRCFTWCFRVGHLVVKLFALLTICVCFSPPSFK